MTLGRVKWFNNSQGFGFISYKSDGSDVDVFVHHSGIKAAEGQFKYLVPGEYVDFELETGDDGKTHAAQVTGVQGGVLMCETRAEIFKSRSQSGETGEGVPNGEGSEWTQVSRRPSGGGRGRGRGRGGRGRAGRGRAPKSEEVSATPRD